MLLEEIGQPMSLLMKQHTAISHLALYDIVNTPGEVLDKGWLLLRVEDTADRYWQFGRLSQLIKKSLFKIIIDRKFLYK